jgi:prepilin-type N-terminal cleavage/methylation domain-containing protein
MEKRHKTAAFTLIELLITVAIFALMIAAIFQILVSAQGNMNSGLALNSVEGTAREMIASIGRDVRESSYAYIFAGDWLATGGAGAVSIVEARNYFSSTPGVGGATLAPGLANEGGGQCPNAACTWCNHTEGANLVPTVPNAFLARPVRNNPQTPGPSSPPPSFSFSAGDARGRLFGHLGPGDPCPFCNTALAADVFFGGLLLFSPRRADNSFSYGGDSGYEAVWESMVFYCPFRNPNTGNYEMRRYAFFASDVPGAGGPPANLFDLLDFDGNGVIESPPMTDQTGNFVLDADGERFCLVPAASGTGNDLLYTRWATGRLFRIQVDRATGAATVTVTGGAFPGTHTIPLRMKRFALGLSDFDASTFINNPSWNPGAPVNPTGVMEPGIVRITLQVDRPGQSRRGNVMDHEETVQTTALRPRN